MQISDIRYPWRDRYREASYRGALFHMDTQARASGRRSVLHEFAKRDVPYAEDMGRRARRFHVTGYIIGPDYLDGKEELETALETEGPGTLCLPMQEDLQVVCPTYTVSERREQGAYCIFEMEFVEAGQQAFNGSVSTSAAANDAADALDAASKARLDKLLKDRDVTE
jgi:prophage DNA circulation protein